MTEKRRAFTGHPSAQQDPLFEVSRRAPVVPHRRPVRRVRTSAEQPWQRIEPSMSLEALAALKKKLGML